MTSKIGIGGEKGRSININMKVSIQVQFDGSSRSREQEYRTIFKTTTR